MYDNIESISYNILLCAPFLSIIGYALVLAIRPKYKWTSLITVIFWACIGLYVVLCPIAILVFPEFISNTAIWPSARALVVILYLLLLVLYLIFNKKLLFHTSYGLMLLFIIEYLYSFFFGTYSGP